MAALPSFVELMASLGLQDQVSPQTSQTVIVSNAWSAPSTGDSISTGYSSASTPPITSPPYLSPDPMTTSTTSPKRDRSGSIGRNLHPRYSPYGPEQRDLYARRGSFPGTATEMNDLKSDRDHSERANSLSPSPRQDSKSGATSPINRVEVEVVDMDVEQDDQQPASSPRAPYTLSKRARGSRSQTHLRRSSWSRRMLVEQEKEGDIEDAVASISSLLRGSPTVSRLHPNGGSSAPGSAPATKTKFTFAPYSTSSLSPNPLPQPLIPNKGNYISTAKLLATEDSTRSFSQRRRRRGSRYLNEPPPPLTIPTLPSIPTLGPRSSGYVSRRESHSPRSGGGWRSRRSTPPTAPVQS